MHYHLKSHSLASATLLLLLLTPLLPLSLKFEPLIAQAQTTQDRKAEMVRLNEEGLQLLDRSQFREALEKFQKALVIIREIGDRQGEGDTLNNIGRVYRNLGQYAKALEFFNQALAIRKEVGDKGGEGTTLNNIGLVYRNLGQYPKALEFFSQVLAIVKEVGDKAGQGTTLNNIGLVYNSLGQYPKALEFYQQALAIRTEIGDKAGEGTTLSNIGGVHDDLGQYAKALEFYQQALAIRTEIGDKAGEGNTFNSIGVVYRKLGQYPKALEFYQQALAISKDIGDKAGEGTTLNNIGLVYDNLGQYPKALEFYQQALAIHTETGDKAGEGATLNNIGLVYNNLGQYPKALEFYQQALAILTKIGDKAEEGNTLSNIGVVYRKLGQYPKALEFYQQALAIRTQIGDKAGEGNTLSNIGAVNHYLGQYPKALEFYQQALTIRTGIGDKAGEGTTLNNIGFLLEAQNQPELAIVFFKQSVNVIEGIRQDLRVLPKEQQQSFTQTVAGTYRALADLLLKQKRVLEAQRILDLLKVQELEDYLRNVQGNNNTAQGLPNLPPEQKTWTSYQAILNKAVEIGKELTQLRKLKQQNGTLTPAQEQRIAQLVKAQETIREGFNNFIRSPEVLALVTQGSPETLSQDLLLQMGNFNALQDNLKNLQQNAVLLYPLILDDRIELILTTPDSPPIRRTVSVPKKQLNETIAAFRRALQNPTSDAKTPAQQLYTWLIKPLEADLKTADAQTIIYAPDAQLRYIPLAALYDGQQWLVQRYRINNITAASLTELNTKPQRQLRVLAGAFATGRYNFTVGGQSFDFAGLPFAGAEVENLAKTVPATTKFIDKAFTPEVTVPKMDDYSIVHLATHGALVLGTPNDSFILFGNGERITLADMQKWSLKNVDLVVLSACETGLSGKLGNGEEILGLGYQMQRAGARAAIASLWQVSDGGTQVLMNAFYAALNKSMTKAEALRQAQIALITKDLSGVGGSRGEEAWIEVVSTRTGLPPQVSNNLSHPYYWAPFILIGNGL
jgi:CHAT domain-containing protein/Tfp pilus assembly protein PilF